ncbi:MAG: TetR/AcrR family transcriptional regulator C-terminal domain-containing protein [Eubacteriales bacterium]|nr:TetR/AcrR family transcriptional regulator C-terminal domain-containing protein [Eubacteriales bacterium]
MADSNITKRALALALRELMEEYPFDKIQVAHICEKCGMNRKSFYYHFKDKYDLLNWIFDTEIISFVQNFSKAGEQGQRIEIFQAACDYFYENRSFYRKALKIEGQNSFSGHFREYIMAILKIRLADLIGDDADEFALNFFTDAVVGTVERWLLDKNCMPPDEFVARSLRLVQHGAEALNKELNQEKADKG